MSTEFYLNVDSKDRISGTISNFYYQYTSRNVTYNEKYLVGLKKLEFPAGCIYQVNSTNNNFYYSIAGNNATFTAQPGNYTISELISQINTHISDTITTLAIANLTFTLSYDVIQNKLGYVKGGTAAGSNVCRIITGLFANDTKILLGTGTVDLDATTSVQYAPNQIDMSPLDYVFLRCNQVYSNSYINNNYQSNDILYRIQLAVDRNNKLYLDESDFKDNLIELPKLTSNFNFYITDKDGRQIDLNGIDYSFQLRLIKI